MYLFYLLYVLSGALQTQSSPVTSETSSSGNLDKIPFGEPCEVFGYTGVVKLEAPFYSDCSYDISAAEGVWKTSAWQFQSYHSDGSNNPLKLMAGKTCCVQVPCAAPYEKSFCRNSYKLRMVLPLHIGFALATKQGNPFIATGKEDLLCPQFVPNSPISCWIKKTDPIPPPSERQLLKGENTVPGQDAVGQTPSTDSGVSVLDTTFESAFNPQSSPADYTTQETTGLAGILPAADQQSQVAYNPFEATSAEVPGIQASTSQPNQLAYNDFQTDDLSSLFAAKG